MIIRATFHDNDFKRPLESFFGKGLYLMLKYANEEIAKKEDPSNMDLIKFKEVSILIDKFCRMIQDEKEFSKRELGDFKALLEYAYKYYIEHYFSESADYLTKELEITILDKIEDKWENGEVLYFFPMHSKYIIM